MTHYESTDRMGHPLDLTRYDETEKERRPVLCPHCGYDNQEQQNPCPQCGNLMIEEGL